MPVVSAHFRSLLQRRRASARIVWTVLNSRCCQAIGNEKRKCADTIGTVLVLWAGHFQWQNKNIFFSNKLVYTGAILSNGTRKLLRFEITRMLNAVQKNKSVVSFIIIFGILSFAVACFLQLIRVVSCFGSDVFRSRLVHHRDRVSCLYWLLGKEAQTQHIM